jgi:hypothetical protein
MVQIPPPIANIITLTNPRISTMSVTALFPFTDGDEELAGVALDPAGALGVNVAAALERHDVAAADMAAGAGAFGTTVAFPAKLQDWALRFVAS